MRERDVSPIGQVATGSVLWRAQGRLHLTVIVKATYAFRLRRPMLVRDPEPVLAKDRYYDSKTSCAVRVPSDAAPYLRRADVVFVGSAYPPNGMARPISTVRLALTGAETLLDKTLHIYGDRRLLAGEAEPPSPFTRIPLVYERAVRDRDGVNPIGRVEQEGDLLPNIVDPEDLSRPAGFGPLARDWAVRRDRISSTQREGLRRPTFEMADGFDWGFFQSAPRDQRVSHLRGDEWLMLEGLDPAQWRVQTRLPGGVAAAWVWPRGQPAAAGRAVDMNADALFIDGDAGTCTLSWRGAFAIEREQVLEAVHIAAGVQYAARHIDWSTETARVAAAVPGGIETGIEVDSTGMMRLAASHAAPKTAALPAMGPGAWAAAAAMVASAQGNAPAVAGAADTGGGADDLWSTMVGSAPPSSEAPRPEQIASGAPGRSGKTQSASLDGPGSLHAPFWVAHQQPASAPLRPVAVPGAPWTQEQARQVPTPSSHPLESTMALADAQEATAAPPPMDQVWRARGFAEPPRHDSSPPPPSAPPPPDQLWQRQAPPPLGPTAQAPNLESTLSVTSDVAADLSAPYSVAKAGQSTAKRSADPIPDAPWVAKPAGRAPVPVSEDLESTISVEMIMPSVQPDATDDSTDQDEVAPDGLGAAFLDALDD